MNILVTGSSGFVGTNLVENIKNIRDGKNKTRPELKIDEIYCFDIDTPIEKLDEFCKNADFVFNLAGVNRPKNTEEFKKGNSDFAENLLNTLKKYNNKCGVMLSSSIQACCEGRYNGPYGESKKLGEDFFFQYGEETGAPVYVFRFPNLFGKYAKPNYNSAVTTFCYNVARDLPITINDRNTVLELLHIDDLVNCMLDLLEGTVNHCDYMGAELIKNPRGKYCYAKNSHVVTLGQIEDLLNSFSASRNTLVIPETTDNSFAKKLYSTFISYLPEDKVTIPLKMNIDERGSFTELLKTFKCGQFSVNISKPGITKGQHWHNQKWEYFIVVKGKGRIEERKIGTNDVLTFDVSGDNITAVHMLPGYTHNIINLSDTEDLVTVMWANEQFDPKKPDTFFEEVTKAVATRH